MGIEGVLKKGFITTSADTVLNYMRTGSLWPVTFGLACCAVEMMHAGMARYDLDRFGIIFRPSPRQADLIDCGGYAHQQNGACTAPRVRPARRAALGIVYGLVCQRRRLLSLFLFRRARCRPRRASRRLCAGLSADCGSPDLRPDSAPAKNQAHFHHRA